MYFVGNKSFDDMYDAISFCSSGPIDSTVINEEGTILMKHKEVPIEDIFGMIIAKKYLD
jgi:hypothetical protein